MYQGHDLFAQSKNFCSYETFGSANFQLSHSSEINDKISL